MTEEEQIEVLARRMYEIAESTPFGHGDDWSDAGVGAKSEFLAIAEECRRQMEWARRCTIGVEVELTTEGRKLKLRFDPLGLAPPDWKVP